jgi:hypothetical protein
MNSRLEIVAMMTIILDFLVQAALWRSGCTLAATEAD